MIFNCNNIILAKKTSLYLNVFLLKYWRRGLNLTLPYFPMLFILDGNETRICLIQNGLKTTFDVFSGHVPFQFDEALK